MFYNIIWSNRQSSAGCTSCNGINSNCPMQWYKKRKNKNEGILFNYKNEQNVQDKTNRDIRSIYGIDREGFIFNQLDFIKSVDQFDIVVLLCSVCVCYSHPIQYMPARFSFIKYNAAEHAIVTGKPSCLLISKWNFFKLSMSDCVSIASNEIKRSLNHANDWRTLITFTYEFGNFQWKMNSTISIR